MAAKNVDVDGKIYVGKASQPAYLTLKLGNRHGIVTGSIGRALVRGALGGLLQR